MPGVLGRQSLAQEDVTQVAAAAGALDLGAVAVGVPRESLVPRPPRDPGPGWIEWS